MNRTERMFKENRLKKFYLVIWVFKCKESPHSGMCFINKSTRLLMQADLCDF